MRKNHLFLLPLALLLLSCGGQSSSSSSVAPSPSNSSSSSLPSSESSSSSSESSSSTIFSSEEKTSSVSSSESESSSEESTESSLLTSESLPTSEESYSSEESSSEDSSKSSAPSSESSSSVEERDPSTLYGGYYKDLVSWTDGEDLKQQLHDIISGGTYTPITYAGSITNWDSNKAADQDLYDHEFLDVVYSYDAVDKDATNSKWQREHAFCASLMTGSTTSNAVKHLGRATDFHNLFASASSANSSRGNKNYGTANKTDEGYIDRTINNGRDGYSFDPKTFEPGNVDKGRLSRAIFYMATMYSEPDYDDSNHVLMEGLKVVEEDVPFLSGEDCHFAIGHLSTLLSWSDYAVDLLEYQHNEMVYSYVPEIHSNPEDNVAQGNRNPYVDFPGLVDYAFGSKKDEPGELKDFISSYETLDIGGEGIFHYAISSAKRTYSKEETFSKNDLHVVSVDKNFNEAEYYDYSLDGVSETEPFGEDKQVNVRIHTEINDLEYAIKIKVSTDPIDSALWKHKVTAKSPGNDFYGINTQNGVAHTLDFDGVLFDVYFQEGSVQSNYAKLGCKFGTSTAPVKTLKFITHGAFEFQDCVNVNSIYLRGAAASGYSYDVDFYVGEQKLAQQKINYPGQDEVANFGVRLEEPVQGQVSIIIRNITSAVYVQYLAINAI